MSDMIPDPAKAHENFDQQSIKNVEVSEELKILKEKVDVLKSNIPTLGMPG